MVASLQDPTGLSVPTLPVEQFWNSTAVAQGLEAFPSSGSQQKNPPVANERERAMDISPGAANSFQLIKLYSESTTGADSNTVVQTFPPTSQ